jgi:hypothetical protein
LLSDGAAALCRGLVRIQHAIAGPTPARYHDELDLYLEERYGGHRRWSA